MKKIGIVCNLMQGYGGVQLCVIELIAKLNAKGLVPYIISSNEVDVDMYSSDDKVRFKVYHQRYSLKESLFKYKIIRNFKDMFFYLRTSWIKEDFDFLYFFESNVIVDDDRKYVYYLSNSPRSSNVGSPKLSQAKLLFYSWFIKRFIPIFEFKGKNCVINSKYTKEMYKTFYGDDLQVVYPPSSIDLLDWNIKTKESKSVVIFSRISPSKRQDLVIELAKQWKDFNFHIIGAVNECDVAYYESLVVKCRSEEIKNIYFQINLPKEQVDERLLLSEYYLFLGVNEHFGITTVEAICCGCLPLVHDSGGQVDIVPLDFLRFNDTALKERFKSLVSMSSSERENTVEKLRNHLAKNFLGEVYGNKMIKQMEHFN